MSIGELLRVSDFVNANHYARAKNLWRHAKELADEHGNPQKAIEFGKLAINRFKTASDSDLEKLKEACRRDTYGIKLSYIYYALALWSCMGKEGLACEIDPGNPYTLKARELEKQEF